MKIIIIGAGQVGGTLAENLVGENNEITLIDVNVERLRSQVATSNGYRVKVGEDVIVLIIISNIE